MKKNDVVYGDLDGRMVPLPRCSFTNFRSSASSGCESGISFLGSDAGAPGLTSMAWSHRRDGGNSCEASSLNTLKYCRYCLGILSSSAGLVGSTGSIMILPIKY